MPSCYICETPWPLSSLGWRDRRWTFVRMVATWERTNLQLSLLQRNHNLNHTLAGIQTSERFSDHRSKHPIPIRSFHRISQR